MSKAREKSRSADVPTMERYREIANVSAQEWRQWRYRHMQLIFETGLYDLTATRENFFHAMHLGWRHAALARLWEHQREALRRLLWTVAEDPESVWPKLYAGAKKTALDTEQSWDQAPCERDLDSEALRRATPRQLRLFAAECCRRAPRFSTLRCDEALDIIEQYADDQADAGDLAWAREAATAAATWARANYDQAASETAELLKLAAQVHLRSNFKMFLTLDEAQRASWRELLGNPFRSLRDRPTAAGDAKRLAAAIYAERAFDGLPMLGDALEEIGCRDERLLAHCRDTGIQHTRGCWALDWVLGAARR